MPQLLVIDNYDSFTYNLVQMFMAYELSIRVFRNDSISVETIRSLRPDYVLVSPGPKDPQHAGISIPLVRVLHRKTPLLGVCLGMQCFNEAFGGSTVRAPLPMHGKTSTISHTGEGVFADMPTTFTAARYHSLMVSPGNGNLRVTARSEDGVIMGISHVEYPYHGVQFHPESFLTESGIRLIENFLKLGPCRGRRETFKYVT